LQFTITYALQSMDIILKSTDSVYSGKAIGFYEGQYFTSRHGNFGMEVNSDNTLCGQFFFNDISGTRNVSIGKFTKMPFVLK
jgi:hypothetical protein